MMKYFVVILLLMAIVSCENESRDFEPIELTKDLTDNQIDSILTKYHFQYEKPILIDSTDQLLIPVSTKLLDRRVIKSMDGYYSSDFPRFWNILFYDKQTGVNRLLTTNKTRISQIHVNRKQMENQTMKSLIFYEMTQTDYDQDGRLTELDPEFLYASKLNGDDLVQVSPNNEDLRYFEVIPNSSQILIRTLRDTNHDSIFDNEDLSILYKAEFVDSDWNLTEIIDSTKRDEIEKLYFRQWLTKTD